MAVCDSKYRFTLVDIGDSGSQSDGSVFANSFLGHAMENDMLNNFHHFLIQKHVCLLYLWVMMHWAKREYDETLSLPELYY